MEGNRIGTDITGTHALGNLRNGIVISDGSGNQVGGIDPGARNIISANGQSGVYLLSASNQVLGNFIGTNLFGTRPLGNAVDGVTINGAPCNQVGPGNLISGNRERGILITGTRSSGNVVEANFIGTDFSRRLDLGNLFSGVGIANALGNRVGGPSSAQRNVISANRQSGLAISGAAARDNQIEGNYIGVDGTGTNALPNHWNGVIVAGAPGNRIGTERAGNLISGNLRHGILAISPAAFTSLEPLRRPIEDADGDGVSNFEEFLAGTDPRDPASALRMLDVIVDEGATRVRFQSVSGRRYQIVSSEAPDGPWTPLAAVTLITASESITELTDPRPTRARRYYRVTVVSP